MSCSYPSAHPGHSLTVFNDDEARWRAVQTRDAAADGLFVYAVRTTKVYCRPICKARLARRSNVRFYPTGLDAQTAGFRACKRCRPEVDGLMPEERAVRQIRRFVVEQAGEGLSLSQMAGRSGLSKWHFHRVFKRTVGVTPFEFLQRDGAAWGGGSTGTGTGTGDDLWAMTLDADGSGEGVSELDLGFVWDDLLVWPDEVTG